MSRPSAADERDQAGSRRDEAADARDDAGTERDQAADERDDAGTERDQAADERDRAGRPGTGAADEITPDAVHLSAMDRGEAASDRRRARQDRRAGASERTHSGLDRNIALADRGASATERGGADALRASETKQRFLAGQLAAAQRVASIGSWEWDIPGNVVSWSAELCRLYGVGVEENSMSYAGYLARIHPEDRAEVDVAIREALATGEGFRFDHRVALPDGSVRIVRCRGVTALGEAGVAVGMTGTAQDVTDHEVATEALRKSESRLAEAQGTARLGSWEWDVASDQMTWSDELCNLFGLDRATLLGTYQGYLDQVHPEDRNLAASVIGRAFETRGKFAFDHRVVRPDGAVTWIHSRGRVEVGSDGAPTRMSGTAADITEGVSRQHELASLAQYDDLTGLYNRRGFLTLADQQLKVAARAGRTVPLLFIDVDGMKTINDTFGHHEGDRALVDVAKFLRTTLRASDVVARLGGDEFCILMVDDGGEGKMDIDRVVAEVRSGPARAERPYSLQLSLGVAWLEPGSGTSVEALMGRADGAMYVEKRSRRRRARVLVIDQRRTRRCAVEKGLRSSYDVTTASTAAAALDDAAAHLPDIVLMGHSLPDMHSAELLRRLRALPGGEGVSVLVIAAGPGRTTELESLHYGADDYVVEPLDLDVLKARMNNVLARSSSRPRRLGA